MIEINKEESIPDQKLADLVDLFENFDGYRNTEFIRKLYAKRKAEALEEFDKKYPEGK